MTALPGPPAAVWDGLALSAGNMFASREWCECWWEHFGEGEPIVLTDDADSPRVVLPLFRSGRALRRWRIIGTGPADQLGPACAPEDLPVAADLLRELLGTGSGGWDVALLQDIPAEETWARLPGATEVRRVPSPVATLGFADWPSYLATRSKNFREQVRRKERRLDRDFSTTLRAATLESLDQDLDTFFALHAARWGEDTPMAHGTLRAFHADFARRAAARGWLRLWMLELDGRVVAGSLCFRFGDAEYQYQSGRDPGFDEYSVGSVLMAHTIRHAVETGAREYRLLRGDEGYKSRWADVEREVHTLALSRGVRGAAAVRLATRRDGGRR